MVCPLNTSVYFSRLVLIVFFTSPGCKKKLLLTVRIGGKIRPVVQYRIVLCTEG